MALDLLDEARAAADRLDDAADAEALHDFRVAVRRLRSTFRAWRGELKGSVRRKHREELRALQAATGAGRDAEVALEWLDGLRPSLHPAHRRGHDWLVARLRSRHDAAMAHAREGVRARYDALEERLRPRLERLTLTVHLGEMTPGPTFARAFAEKARAHADRVVRRLSAVTGAEHRDGLHAARIAVKRLRYLVEPLRPHVRGAGSIVKRCKRLQDVLGDANDAHVLSEELGAALEQAAVERARRLHELSQAADADALRREGRRSQRPGLLELTRRCRSRLEDLHLELEDRWLQGRGLQELSDGVDVLASELERLSSHAREIERKYLLRERPEAAPAASVVEIDQGWLPGRRLRERLRRTRRGGEERYYRTVKLGEGLERIEIEEETSREVFEALWPLTEGCRVRKRRHRIEDGSFVWEVDEFLDRELVLAEVELPDRDTRAELPEWLAGAVVREVTDDPAYVNLNLAR